jgi:outer membrane protein
MSKLIKKFITFFVILNIYSFSYAEDKIAYIDMDFILKNSNASKSLLNQLTDIEMKQFEDFKNKEERFKNEENKILSSKNILSKDEYLKKVNIFKNDLNNYQNKKNEIINKFKLKRNNEIRDFMKSISPLINDFMTKNFIGILIEKKNIFIAKSNYDITESILEIINKEIKDYRISDDK